MKNDVGPRRPVRRSREATGVLLLLVLSILSVLFVMAMTQYLVTTVTRSKQVHQRITVTDYACESALDEALVQFKSRMNPMGERPAAGPMPIAELHKALTTTGKAKDISYEPVATRARYRELYGRDVNIEPVRISFDSRRISMQAPVKPAAAPPQNDIETKGIITFQAIAFYDGTQKTMRRAYEYRQTIIQPPGRLQDCVFAATDWRYLQHRLDQIDSDWDALRGVVQQLVQRVCFAYSLMIYICNPQQLFGDQPGTFVKAGFHFAQSVLESRRRKIEETGDEAGVDTQLRNQLQFYAAGGGGQWAPNPNFNVEYLQAMAKANDSNLRGVLDALSTDFGFTTNSQPPLLNSDEPYPLSPTRRPSGEFASSWAVNGRTIEKYRVRNWGKTGVIGEFKDPDSGTAIAKPEIAFTFASSPTSADGPTQPISTGGRLPEFVVPAAEGTATTVESEDLRIHMRAPPIMPTQAIDDATPPAGEQSTVQGSVGMVRENLDDYINDCRIKRIAHLDLDDFSPEIREQAASGEVSMPPLALTHPRTEGDWGFRISQHEYETNFADRKTKYDEWKTHLLQRVKVFADGIRNLNANKLPKKVLAIDPGNNADGRSLADELGDTELAGKRAAFRFQSQAEFNTAMAELGRASNLPADTLPLDGVYLVDDGQPAAAHGETPAERQLLKITQTQFRGHGVIAAPGIELTRGIQAADTEGRSNLILWGTEAGVPVALGGKIMASVLSRGPLSITDQADVNGVLAVQDVPCRKAQPVAENRSNPALADKTRPGSGCAGSGSSDKVWASYYWTDLPRFTVTYKKPESKERWVYSHFNLTPFRIAAGGQR